MTAASEIPDAALAERGKTPDFYVVGHAKSGTTAIYAMLKSHPQIYMADLKETRFFARELHPGLESSRAHPRTLDEYIALFSPASPEQLVGEVSPSYLRSMSAAARIAEIRPDARIIAVLREPVSFVRSLHLQLLEDHVETEKDLGSALAREPQRLRERDSGAPIEQGLLYGEHVHYVEQLERFRAAFGPEQMLVLIYDDFDADNEGTMRRLLRFLGVAESPRLETSTANPTVRVRSPRLYGLVRSLYLGEGRLAAGLKRAIKAITPRRLRQDGMTVLRRRVLYGEPRQADLELTRELRRRFSGEVSALSAYLGRDLVSLWGYDGGG